MKISELFETPNKSAPTDMLNQKHESVVEGEVINVNFRFPGFIANPAGKVEDVFNMDQSDLEVDEIGDTQVWVHAAAVLLKAKNLNQLLICDNEENPEEFENIDFTSEKEIDVGELGYDSIKIGKIKGVKAVFISDHGYGAFVILK